MDRSPAPISTVPVARGRSLDPRVSALVLGLVALTLVRPWGAAAPSVPASASLPADQAGVVATATSAADRATPRPSLAPDQIPCTGVSAQLVSLDRLGPWTARTWVDAHPVIATGPLDPTIQEVVLASQAVLGVGVCLPATAIGARPSSGADPTASAVPALGATVVAAWSVSTGRPRPLALQPLRPVGGMPGLAILYRPGSRADQPGSRALDASRGRGVGDPSPSAAADPSQAAWPPGRYVLRLSPVPPASTGDAQPASPDLYLAIVVADRT